MLAYVCTICVDAIIGDNYIIVIVSRIIISMCFIMSIIIVAYINIVPLYVYAVHFHIPSTHLHN